VVANVGCLFWADTASVWVPGQVGLRVVELLAPGLGLRKTTTPARIVFISPELAILLNRSTEITVPDADSPMVIWRVYDASLGTGALSVTVELAGGDGGQAALATENHAPLTPSVSTLAGVPPLLLTLLMLDPSDKSTVLPSAETRGYAPLN
jgi:hypothetical protein